MEQRKIFDMAVIGAGPVGLFSVFAAGQLGLNCVVVDGLDEIGGQCAALYPTKPIYDIPAFASVTGGELIERLHRQAQVFEPHFLLRRRVKNIHKIPELFEISLDDGTHVHAKTIIVAAGAGAFGPNRPPLVGLTQYEPEHVRYSVTQPQIFKNKKVVIAGGGDSAVDWAVLLSEYAEKLHVVHRRDRFRAAPSMVQKMKQLAADDVISMHVPAQLSSVHGESGILTHVGIKQADEEKLLEADILLPFYGLKHDMSDLEGMGFEIIDGGLVVDSETMTTNIPGIYAVGDVARYPHKLKLILTGFAEATQACHQAFHNIYPDVALPHEHSTTRGKPGLS